MINFPDILKREHVDLSLHADDLAQAIQSLARRFEGDPRVLDFPGLLAGLRPVGAPLGERAILSHVRSDSVATMLMAAGRRPGQARPKPEGPPRVGAFLPQFVFLIAVPTTLGADYLRILGALARCLRNPATVVALGAAEHPEEFVEVLSHEAEAM